MKNPRGRILFIAFDYHDYTRGINAEFQALGFDSRFHSLQPGKPYLKVARRLPGPMYQTLLNRYHRRIILTYAPNAFDHVVFLQVHQFSHENLALLKARQASAHFSLYNWDAVSTHDYRPYLGYFDSAHTFDPADARALGINYLPLFCMRKLQGLPREGLAPMSAYFVGNIVNPERYRAVMAFDRFCRSEGIAFRHYLSTTVHGWTTMRRAGIRPGGVSLRAMRDDDFIGLISAAAAVFDFANHRQTGFTMRTMENLCAGRKIITNNPNVRSAEFYSDDRFLIFENQDFSGVVDFLKRPLERRLERFDAYHIQNFSRRLLGI